MADYPIINQRSLPKAERGRFGFRSRSADDIPLPSPHESVVYKSGGVYVIDDGRSRLDDDHVRNATNFSVVDMRLNAPILAGLQIPAVGGAEFTVQVTFLCTVRRADEVVAAGLHDLEERLTEYLKQHQPLFHIGERFELDDINSVRRDVTAEIKAYASVRPPHFPGLAVSIGGVQVLTPEEHAQFEQVRRERRRENQLSSEEQQQLHALTHERDQLQHVREIDRQSFTHQLTSQAELNNQRLTEMQRQIDEQLELQRRKHEQVMAEMRQQLDHTLAGRQLTFDQQAQTSSLRHGQGLHSEAVAHERELRSSGIDRAIEDAGKIRDVIGADQSELPGLLAAAAGEQSLVQAADRLDVERERQRQVAADNALREKTWAREDTLYQQRSERQDAEFEFKIKLGELQAQADIVSAGIARGLLDHQTFDKVMSALTGMVRELESASDSGKAEAGRPDEAAAGTQQPADSGDSSVIDAEIVPDRDASGGQRSDSSESAIWEENIGT